MSKKLDRYDFEGANGDFYRAEDVDARIAYLEHGRPAIFATMTPDEVAAAYIKISDVAHLQSDIAILRDTAKGAEVVTDARIAGLTEALTGLLASSEAVARALAATPGNNVPDFLSNSITKARAVIS